MKRDFKHEELFDAYKRQDYDRVMKRYPIQAGDTVYVPGGIIHSFGPGTLIFEIQQTSDLVQNVMPTDLYGRAHSPADWDAAIRDALTELKTDYLPKPNIGLGVTFPEGRARYGAVCKAFALERWQLDEAVTHDLDGRRCSLISNVGAPIGLRFDGGEEDLQSGESCILPAALGEVEIIPTSEDEGADLVYCYVPDREIDVIEPLQDAGFTDEDIATLGHVFSDKRS